MQMECSYQMMSPQQGCWTQECEQDFCEGANVLNSLHPASSTPSSSIFNEHLDDLEWMDCGDLEAFSDVILPEIYEETHFKSTPVIPEIYKETHFKCKPVILPEIYEEKYFETKPVPLPEIYDEKYFESKPIFQQQQDTEPLYTSFQYNDYATDILYSSPEPEHKINEVQKPKITIKLKRVKCRKKNIKLTDHSFTSPFHQNDPPSQSDSNSCEYLVLQSPNNIEIDPLDIANVSPSFTLKEIINMEDADVILGDCLLNTSLPAVSSASCENSEIASCRFFNTSSPGVSSASSDNSDMSSCEDSQSLASRSPCLSPSNEQSLPIPYYALTVDIPDTATVSSKRRSGGREKCKKLRQKLSPESRYIRKKEQNKQAALRYRVKKKQEDEELMTAIRGEEQESEELQKNYTNLKQEIAFLKKLMRETLIAKKMVAPNAFD